MKKTTFLLALAMAALLGCSQPRDTIIPSDPAAWEKELAPKIQALSAEDRQALAAYLVRAKLGEAFGGKAMPIGVTVRQALEDQKAWAAQQLVKQAEEQALKEKLTRERAEAAQAMDKLVTVTLLEKREIPPDIHNGRYRPEQAFKIGVRNKSDKELIGVSGGLEFIDVFDKRVGIVNFGISERIKAGQDFIWSGSRDYNKYEDDEKAIWNLATGKYTTRFVPEKLVYADGTKLSAPE